MGRRSVERALRSGRDRLGVWLTDDDRLAVRRGAQRVGGRARARRGAAERISAVRERSLRSRSRSASAAWRVTAPATWSDPLLTTQ